MRNAWYLNRRAVLVMAALLSGLLAVLLITGVIVHFTAPPGHATGEARPEAQPHTESSSGATGKATSTPHKRTGRAQDAARWDAMAVVQPAVSATMPAIAAPDRGDPAAFARAFAIQLFTRDYPTESRTELLRWIQAQDAPLRSPNYPSQDWTKVLVDSLTDPTWDNAAQTPVPTSGTWGLLAEEGARDTVSEVSVRTDPQWESTVAGGYQPPDQLTTVQDVTLLVTRRTGTGSKVRTSSIDVSLAIQLGTSPLSGYGAAATNNFVSRAVS